MWNGCISHGVFETHIECVETCNQDEDPGICAIDHPKSCTDDQYRRIGPATHYFYNIINGTCEKYSLCNTIDEVFKQNSFYSEMLCTMQCIGFSWKQTSVGKTIARRQLFQMLDTRQPIWIYSASYNQTDQGIIESCVNHKTLYLRPFYLNYSTDFRYRFSYQRVTNNETTVTLYSGRVGNCTNNTNCIEATPGGVLHARRNTTIKLALWDAKKQCGILVLNINDPASQEGELLESLPSVLDDNAEERTLLHEDTVSQEGELLESLPSALDDSAEESTLLHEDTVSQEGQLLESLPSALDVLCMAIDAVEAMKEDKDDFVELLSLLRAALRVNVQAIHFFHVAYM
ncbi:hypothetical protein MTO96_051276 [Rhipicephalus appendiculatus]